MRIMSKKKKALVFFLSSACILLSALLLFSIFPLNRPDDTERIIDSGRVINGVSINGIDVSGMTEEEVSRTAQVLSKKLLEQNIISVNVDGKNYAYTAGELGARTDFNAIASEAYIYGHCGTFDVRFNAFKKAGNGGVDFPLYINVSKSDVATVLGLLHRQMDIDPINAEYKFFPHGYTADGKSIDNPDGSGEVRLAEHEMPNALRYQYWHTNKYIKDYIPKDASISRFQYTEGKDGLAVDIGALADKITISINSGNYSLVNAPFTRVEPETNIADLKYRTQLIASWTSSYVSHDNANRNYNIAKLSGIINGVVIAPGQTWSINKEAGPRTKERGWKDAPGITKGATFPQPGGGVCQVSSTTYNAALRANLEIVDSTRHSIISNYIPIGLDATISTGYPDLKLRNPYNTPVFIISYVNKKDKNITVEIYGHPVTDKQYGEVILNFSSKVIGHTDSPVTKVHHYASRTPNGRSIAPGSRKTYISAKRGTTAQTYIHYLSLDGKELYSKEFYVATYPKTNGEVYVNDIKITATPLGAEINQ